MRPLGPATRRILPDGEAGGAGTLPPPLGPGFCCVTGPSTDPGPGAAARPRPALRPSGLQDDGQALADPDAQRGQSPAPAASAQLVGE